MKNVTLARSAGLLAAVVGLLFFLPLRASAASPPAGYPFLCRGQLTLISNFDQLEVPIAPATGPVTETYKVTLDFRVNPTKAGDAGEDLQAGACAWTDRATNSGEGTKLQFNFKYSTYPLNAHMLSLCSVTPNCVFKVIATNPGDGSPLQGPSGFYEIQLIFPANLGYTIIPDPAAR